MTDEEALKEIDRQEKRFATAKCGRGLFVTDREARMVLANAVEQAYDFNPQLATANVRQEVEDAVRDGRKDCFDAKGNLVCRYTVEQE